MSKRDYTKGPWVVEAELATVSGDELYCASIYPVVDDGTFRGSVAIIQSCDHLEHGISQAEAEANARLIAAAPELLEALTNLIAAMDRDGNCTYETLREDARHVVARATWGAA